MWGAFRAAVALGACYGFLCSLGAVLPSRAQRAFCGRLCTELSGGARRRRSVGALAEIPWVFWYAHIKEDECGLVSTVVLVQEL